MAKNNLPKIAATTTIRSYERTDEGLNVKFRNLKFSSGIQDTLDQFVVTKEQVKVTIEATQERLPGIE